MLLSRRWLTDYVDVSDINNHDFISAMTLSGSKVEGFEIEAEEVSNVVVGKILAIEKHPDAEFPENHRDHPASVPAEEKICLRGGIAEDDRSDHRGNLRNGRDRRPVSIFQVFQKTLRPPAVPLPDGCGESEGMIGDFRFPANFIGPIGQIGLIGKNARYGRW